MTDERREARRARVHAQIGPFPEELRDRYLDWVQGAAAGVWETEGPSLGLRSAMTLGVLTALGAESELRVHIRRAIVVSGLSRDEVVELIRHSTVYAGVPRANDALRVAKIVFDELDAESAG